MTYKQRLINLLPYLICTLFFFAYATLSIVRHLHFGSYGFDLGIADQIVWKYANFKTPLNTIYQHPFTSTLTDHIEFIYILIAPFYKLFPSPLTLIILQSFAVTMSGIPVFLLAKTKKLKLSICYALLISFLMFYGVQNALWFDVHSLSFAAAFLPWICYFLETKKNKAAILFFFLAIFSKEDIALFTFLISFIYFLTTKRKVSLMFMAISVGYLFLIFFVYFPHFTTDGYRFMNSGGLFSDINPAYFLDTSPKQKTIFYGLGSFGFLSLLSPLYLLPAFADLAHYYVLGHSVVAAQDFFMHYRITLSFFLVWPTILAISKFKKYLNNRCIALYILLAAFFFQYFLHLPLSYLSKQWFWTTPASVSSINQLFSYIPKNASVVSQNNITPHLSQRDEIFTLWPDTKNFAKNSPCGKPTCLLFRWAGNPKYLIVDVSNDWDIRHTLYTHDNYLEALSNLEKAGFVKKDKQIDTTIIYKIIKNPNN